MTNRPRRIRLVHLDGKLPNLALMSLSAFWKSEGHEVTFTRSPSRQLGEPDYDEVYASAIFTKSAPLVAELRRWWPDAIVGGTWQNLRGPNGEDLNPKVSDIVPTQFTALDYSAYPEFKASLGFTQRGCRFKCSFCLTDDVQILTQRGPVLIKDVVVGDMVLTHLGRYRRVMEVMRRPYEGPVLEIRSNALSQISPVKVTPEHPFYMRHQSYRSGGAKLTNFRWVGAGEIRNNVCKGHSEDKHAYPRLKDEAHPGTAPGADWLPMTKELAAIVGWYVSDGYIASAPGRDKHSLIIYPGNGEKGLRDGKSIVALFDALGMRSALTQPDGDQYRVVTHGVKFCRWLHEQFGSMSYVKDTPLWFKQLPKEYLEAFLRAYAQGDGVTDMHHGKERIRTCSVSWALTLSVREIALKCGYTGTINRCATSGVIMGRKVNVHDAYTVIITTPKARKMSTAFDADYIYTKAKGAIETHHNGFVYNLEVEEDHSYCTPAFAIHNCFVPWKEGRPSTFSPIHSIWRGPGFPKQLHILDNDFFGSPEWPDRIEEIRSGGFKVCLNQGINLRIISDKQAAALASIQYRNDAFTRRVLYTAFDSLDDHRVFFRGVDRLAEHGIPPSHLMSYMLVGYEENETWERIWERFHAMTARGIKPYVMLHDDALGRPEDGDAPTWKALKRLQRWANMGLYRTVPWDEYRTSYKTSRHAPDARQDILL